MCIRVLIFRSNLFRPVLWEIYEGSIFYYLWLFRKNWLLGFLTSFLFFALLFILSLIVMIKIHHHTFWWLISLCVSFKSEGANCFLFLLAMPWFIYFWSTNNFIYLLNDKFFWYFDLFCLCLNYNFILYLFWFLFRCLLSLFIGTTLRNEPKIQNFHNKLRNRAAASTACQLRAPFKVFLFS